MKFKILLILFLTTISIEIFSQGIQTQTRDNAGASGAGILSGFYETSNPVNFPTGATGWWHLLDVRHTNPGNNHAMQFAGQFSDQNLYFRKTDNNASQQWNKVLLDQPGKKIGIGKEAVLQDKFTITEGHETTTLLMHADNSSYSHAYLTLWASEPNVSWTGVGIGNNIRHFNGSSAFSRINTATGGSYIRLLENEIKFYTVSNNGETKNSLNLYSNGNVSLQGKFEAKEVKVTTTPTADFVFEENYELPKLDEVEKFIKENKHLPEIASAKTMEKEGVNIGEFQIRLLQKIEELTLYSIEQNKKLKEQEQRIKSLENILSSKK